MASNSTTIKPACYRPMPAVSNGILQGDLPLHFALPLLTIQIALVLLVTRSVAILFKPIKQPRVLAEIIGGVLLGPTALGRNKYYMERVFPQQSLPLLETVATMGLMFFIFMVGLELDLQALRKTGKKAFLLAMAGIAVPFAGAAALAGLVRSTIGTPGSRLAPLVVFMGTPLSISAFSVLVRIMAELKLLASDVGRLAVPSAAVNDVTVWTLLALGVAIAGPAHSPLTPVWVILTGAAFGLIMLTVVRLFMNMVARRGAAAASSPSGGGENYVCITLVGVLLAGFFSDAVGVHPLFGPFLFGLVIPKDNAFPKLIVEKIEDFVTGLMLPLFFASSGLKTNLGSLHGWVSLGFLCLFFATAAVGKITGTFVAAKLIGLPSRRALILGFLMNTKGLAVLIVLNIGRDLKALTDELFAILVLTCLLTSFVTTPAVSALVGRPADGEDQKEGATLEALGGRQLRLLACAYERHQQGATASLVEAARGAKTSPIKLYALRLMELTERPSAVHLILRHVAQSKSAATLPPIAFQPSPQLSKVVVRPLTAVSKFDTLHEDICKLAVTKRATMILLPYLPKPSHGAFTNDPELYKVNQRVLQHAPCSVGIVVDRRSMLGAPSPIHPCFFSYKVVVIFLGGPDDREALAFASRMADHPSVSLKVIRIITLDHTIQIVDDKYEEERETKEQTKRSSSNVELSSSWIAPTQERLHDDEAIAKVKERALEASFAYEEEKAEEVEGQSLREAIHMITRTMNDVNLFVIGKGSNTKPIQSMTMIPNDMNTTMDQTATPHDPHDHHHHHGQSELGVVGDMILASAGPNFHACLLVVQQHAGSHPHVSTPSTEMKNTHPELGSYKPWHSKLPVCIK